MFSYCACLMHKSGATAECETGRYGRHEDLGLSIEFPMCLGRRSTVVGVAMKVPGWC